MGVKQIYPGVFEFDPTTEDDDSERLDALIRLSKLPLGTRLTKRIMTFEEILGREEGLEATMAFIRGEIDPPLLLLYGEPGRSKTHLALAIGWAFIAQLRVVAYYHVSELLDDLRQGLRIQDSLASGEFHQGSFDVIMNWVKKCQLLILDDLGVQKDTDWVVDKLDMVVNYRYEQKLPTVITANTLEISDRILDRMKEGRVVLLQGESYREIIQKRKRKVRDNEDRNRDAPAG